jgi:hypothetical protein
MAKALREDEDPARDLLTNFLLLLFFGAPCDGEADCFASNPLSVLGAGKAGLALEQ